MGGVPTKKGGTGGNKDNVVKEGTTDKGRLDSRLAPRGEGRPRQIDEDRLCHWYAVAKRSRRKRKDRR